MGYIKTIFKGTPGSPEVWSVTNSWGIFGTVINAPDQALTDSILSKLLTSPTTFNPPAALNQLASNASTYVGWRVELRGEDERTLSVSEGNIAGNYGGAGVASKTPQDACVFSLRTSTPGPSGRGRMYWPAMGAGLDLSWGLSSPTTASTVAGAKTWLNAIGTQINAGFAALSAIGTVVLSVRSVKNHVCHDVNEIQVGSLLDTQRRRRDNLLETYSNVSYP